MIIILPKIILMSPTHWKTMFMKFKIAAIFKYICPHCAIVTLICRDWIRASYFLLVKRVEFTSGYGWRPNLMRYPKFKFFVNLACEFLQR